ncbi:GNAT family protein [Bacillus sp. FJAT-27264]|uniref:GNAT family N-acetyltransferase n=1 Tax=Paenibacillus sp. (strain DSM 101736 / FJAT-27264) TaxID=1850362 RepID=UPI000AC17501|nr:GNAT family protein [Bacillus sp. FJAT-27264]
MESHNEEMPELVGARVRLRALSMDDAAALHAIWSDHSVARWLGAPALASVEETRELVALLLQMELEEESKRWCIVLPGGQVIGSCGFNYWQLAGAYRGEFGCDLAPAYWGQGYMTEALKLLLDYGFGQMGLNRIEALCHPENDRAQGLVSSLGFQREGLLRQYRHTDAGYQDIVLYALLRQNWQGDY